ncbi:hypothetical protein [Fodinibius sp. AD559]
MVKLQNDEGYLLDISTDRKGAEKSMTAMYLLMKHDRSLGNARGDT